MPTGSSQHLTILGIAASAAIALLPGFVGGRTTADAQVVAQAPIPVGGPAANVQPAIETLIVDRTEDDDAPGSLRWAINQANGGTGTFRIAITAPATGPAPVIRIRRDLPPIRVPLSIEGTAWARDGRHATIDGSAFLPHDLKSCPGLVPGQYGTNVRTSSHPGLAIVDTRGVTIRGIEVRNFCIGILVMRSSNVTIADNRIIDNIGGAGVMFTGDDGKGGSTGTTTVDNKVLRTVFIGNGDGLELTRGAAFTLVADNLFEAGTTNLEPSQGIEILWGNDNSIVRNRFVDFTDGLQINWGARNYIAANHFSGNALGLSVTGADNMIDGNEIRQNGIGIAVRPERAITGNRLSGNRIIDNGKPILRCFTGGSCDPKLPRGGIVMGVPGPEHQEYVGARGMGATLDRATAPTICGSPIGRADCHAAPERGQMPPLLKSAAPSGGRIHIRGTATGPAGMLLTIEFFAADSAGTEGGMPVGTMLVATDRQGEATFDGMIDAVSPGDVVTATTTTAEGATSAFSNPVALSPR